uniref:Serine/threonine-protein kinase ATR n=1 Tax=Dermatophagoides pteronyssinus TaxID=6956 RepID=A0A6P6Y9S2_DERPT|nr:serine/threonine-protein kinase MEC1-like [Dermatophagoides pteronyssinus]
MKYLSILRLWARYNPGFVPAVKIYRKPELYKQSSEQLIYITRLQDEMTIYTSKQKPKVISESTIKPYAVIALQEVCGLIEWIPMTLTLRKIISADLAQNDTKLPRKPIQRGQQELYLKEYYIARNATKPTLHSKYYQLFGLSSSTWIQAKNNFISSTAHWNIFGFMIGLGDRHLDNILVDLRDGAIIHVDFDCILDKGFSLVIPELVPFRYTQNIQAMVSYHTPILFNKMIKLCNETVYTTVINSIKKKFSGRVNYSAVFTDLSDKMNPYKLANSINIVYKNVPWNYQDLSPKAQVELLLKAASDDLNLALMYAGWTSYV